MFHNATGSTPVINKVAQAGIAGIDLADYQPQEPSRDFDITPFLYQGLMLKEKDFKATLEQVNWVQYQDCAVSVHCSSGAILPQWAFMLIAMKLLPFAKSTIFGSRERHIEQRWVENIEAADFSGFSDKKVALRAGSDVPETVYIRATEKLVPLVASLMYGEPGLPKVIYKSNKPISVTRP